MFLENNTVLALVPLMPLVGCVAIWLLSGQGRGLQRLSGWFATLAALCSFAGVVSLFLSLKADPATVINVQLWRWMAVGKLNIDFAFAFDNLTAVMCLVITGIGSLIHLYAIGYMAEDESRPRFFCYLNLFLFSMLILVLGDSLPVMFVGWEGVGLCSYLLIGFWYREMGNADAGQKAFVVNRIGDAGFLLGMFLLFWAQVHAGGSGALDFVGLKAGIGGLDPRILEIAALLLFVGAVGKSAQIPLFVWLPDAMAGPTPVSALIHAATMVTAGVYMITRMSFLYSVTPVALFVIAIVGVLTAFVAATIALVQNDIKKVLAYSTVSQLGFMFMALGVGAFSNGIFHVVTHAFFKACLFMCAGSVIMGCHHEQDMRQFGGLRKKMPITFLCYLCATLAIAGFPFTSGYYSKDALLVRVFMRWELEPGLFPTSLLQAGAINPGLILWGFGTLTAFLTAFYMTRSLVLTFFGTYRGHAHPHESPWVVTVPLVLLAIPSLIFGAFFGQHLLSFLGSWSRVDMMTEHLRHTEHLLENLAKVVAISGIGLAWLIYGIFPRIATNAAGAFGLIYRFLLNKWWFDELYAAIIVKPLRAISWVFFRGIDRAVIDASVDGAGMFVEANGEIASRLHTGRIGQYAIWMFVSSFGVIVLWLLA